MKICRRLVLRESPPKGLRRTCTPCGERSSDMWTPPNSSRPFRPAVMAFWKKTSPYHDLKFGVACPEPVIFTTTKDDRVGPQHARKFAARIEAMKLPFLYFENAEGGHGAGADMRQAARTQAPTMTYLQGKLMD